MSNREEAIQMAEISKALWLKDSLETKGELDAWLECNDEAEVRSAINCLIQLAKNEAYQEAVDKVLNVEASPNPLINITNELAAQAIRELIKK